MKRSFLKTMGLFLAFLMLLPLAVGCTRQDPALTDGHLFPTSAETVPGTVSGTQSGTVPGTEPGTTAEPFIRPPLDEVKNPTDPETLSGVQKDAYLWCSKAYDTAIGGNQEVAFQGEWSQIYRVMSNQMDRYYRYYLKGGMTYTEFSNLMNAFASVSGAKGIALGYLDLAKGKGLDADYMAQAKAWADKNNFMQVALALSKVKNVSASAEAKKMVSSRLSDFSLGITDAVTEFMVRYRIAEGKAFLNGLIGLGVDSHINSQNLRLEEYRKFQEEGLVRCSTLNTMENIYTHCLIAFPEINFASQQTYRWCGDDCLTVSEFKIILQALYDKGYIIVDANLFYDAENDKPVTTLYLPQGKKPLLLTFDDVTYDSRKQGRGMVDKLILDETGRVCTYTKQANGTELISYENEIFPIIEAFVRQHPDFTFRGARGTLFFTGFDGICGYRTQSSPINDAEAALRLDRQNEIRQATQVIEALRQEGWTFGSHSYAHGRMTSFSSARLRQDTQLWLEEVGAIVGETSLFCWPYGGHTAGTVNLRKNEDHKFLFDSGFKFFFGCGANRYLANELDGNGIFSDRKAITGEALYYYYMGYTTYVREYSYLFDPNAVWDPWRVLYKDNYQAATN